MRIYSTISREKEQLETIHKGRVNLFVCGPTVYDDSHIGHARTYIAFDVVARYLKHLGYSVFYLQNITDVDDKIINRAMQRGLSARDLARTFERRYLEDMQKLKVSNVNYYARATEHIPEIIDQIKRLLEKGFAYETKTGVYFDESLFPDFGKLSHQSAEDLKKNRIEPDPTKRNGGDFALWKKRPSGEGESDCDCDCNCDEQVLWDSPWGWGRPGWHIEDTAITESYFGPQYDIHGGARDLIFPHHEAEIAQMEAASGKKPLVRYWMHTGFLNVRGEKMSKSLGNFTTIRDMLKEHDAQAFRLFVLLSHYKSPIDFSPEALRQAQRSLERLRQAARIIEKSIEIEDDEASEPGLAGYGDSDDDLNGDSDDDMDGDRYSDPDIEASRAQFMEHMDNDFNTPFALRSLFDLARDINRGINEGRISQRCLRKARDFLVEAGEVLGIDLIPSAEADDAGGETDSENRLIELLLRIRQELRKKKEWQLADEIRSRMKELGVEVEDS